MGYEISGNRRCLPERFSVSHIGHALFEQGAKAGPLSRLYTDQIGDSALLPAQHFTWILQRCVDEAADRDVRMPTYASGQLFVAINPLCQILEMTPLATDRIAWISVDVMRCLGHRPMTTKSRQATLQPPLERKPQLIWNRDDQVRMEAMDAAVFMDIQPD